MKTKAITEGAMLCALAVIIALFSSYVPFLLLLFFLIPVPMVILAEKQGFKVTLIAGLAATLILFMFMDPLTAGGYGIYMIFVGCSLGYMYYKRKDGFLKLAAAYAGIFAAIILIIILLQVLTGQNFVAMLTETIDTSSAQVMDVYRSLGAFPEEQLSLLQTAVDQMKETMKMVIPLAFLISPFFIGWANVLISDTILKRMRLQVKPLPQLSKWRLPRSFKNFLIMVVIILLVIDLAHIDTIPAVYTYTLMMIIYLLYFLMGISFVYWLINRKRAKESMGLKILIVVLCLFIPYISYIISFVGVADIYIDVRKFIENRDGTNI